MSSKKKDAIIGDQYETMEFMLRFMDLCRDLEDLLERTWKSFILGNSQEGMGELAQVFTDLEQILNQVEILSELQLVKLNSADILQKMSGLENAMGIPDYILTADIIKYEIKPIIVAWRKRVWTVMKKIKTNLN